MVSLVPQEHVQRQTDERFIVHNLVSLEDIVEEVVLVPRQHGQRRTVEFSEDVTFSQVLEGTVGMVELVPQEIADASVPPFREETVGD